MSDFEQRHEREMRARIAALFDMARPWQVLDLMSRHWQEVMTAARGGTYEHAEALFMAAQFRLVSDHLKRLDDRESEEFDREEAAGAFDFMNEFLAEEAKAYKPKPRTYPHRQSPDDGRCVYCGGSDAAGDCEVLRGACASLSKVNA